MDFAKVPWIPMGSIGFDMVFHDSPWFQVVFKVFTGFYRVVPSFFVAMVWLLKV